MDVTDLVLRFVAAVNRHAVEEIAGLLSGDHLFIDSLGAEFRGRDTMRKGWAAYFAMVPDYSIVVDEILASGNTVVVIGSAIGALSKDGCALPDSHWRTPAAWRAVVEGDRLSSWQVFADNEPIRELIRKHGADDA